MGQMVFVPLASADAAVLRSEGKRESAAELVGVAATPPMMAWHDFGASELEDAEFAALSYAGVLALRSAADPLRLVLAVEPALGQLSATDDPYGRTAVAALHWADVRALFVDEPAAADAVAAARDAAGSSDLAGALELPAVQALLEKHDLLWYAPEELDQLL